MIHDEAATSGIDVLAWYVSYRAYAGQWGIFLREDAIVGIGEFLTERHRSLTPSDAADAASRLLMAHEYFHFLVDIGAEVLEDMLGVRLYATWQEESRRRQPPYDLLEEALANAFAYRHGKTRGLAKPTRDFLTRSPVGYRDFGAYVRHDAWSEGLRDLLSALESCAIEPADRPGRWGRELFIDEQQRLVSPFNIPVWLVRRTDQPIWLHLITALGPVTSTATYRRDIARLPAKARDQLQRAVDMAQAGVTPKKLKRLTGYDNRYRLRSGDYRAILDRDRGGGFVAIRAGHRKNIYKGLPA